jgi:A/G-specific adenine glycosylase
MLIIQDHKGRVLLVKRPPAGIWGGLWSLPVAETVEDIESDLGLENTRPVLLEKFEHRLSHRRFLVQPALATAVKPTGVKCSSDYQWLDPADRATVGLPRPVSDLLSQVAEGELK